MKPKKIIIADDHQIVRDGINVLLSAHSDEFLVVAEALNGKEVIEMTKKYKPDIIIMDISMPVINGLEATKIISEKFPDTKILIFSSYAMDDNVITALQYGAKGVLPKNTIRQELLEALRKVANNEEFISKYIPYARILKNFSEKQKNKQQQDEIKNKLTPREFEILKLVVEGASNKEIAEKLFISTRTVEKHKSNILNKLNLKSTVDLVKFAIKHKIIDIE